MGVVVIPCEFEAWLIAGAVGLAGKRGLPPNLRPPPEPEGIRDAKGWLAARMARGYHETRDQEPFAAVFDLAGARSCPSFVRFERLVLGLCARDREDMSS